MGSAGCQSATGRIHHGEPADLDSLPRPGKFALSENYMCKDVAGRAAGDHRLAACAPQKCASIVRYPALLEPWRRTRLGRQPAQRVIQVGQRSALDRIIVISTVQ